MGRPVKDGPSFGVSPPRGMQWRRVDGLTRQIIRILYAHEKGFLRGLYKNLADFYDAASD
jgi:hypothetical protein